MSRRKVGRTLVGKRVVDGQEFVVWRLAPDDIAVAVDQRTHPRQNSFDQSYMKGRFPMWIRHVGGGHTYEFDEGTIDHGFGGRRGTRRGEEGRTWDESGNAEARPVGYNRPRDEEPYVQSLHEFFEERRAMWPATPTQREWLRIVMFDTRSQEDIADDLGLTQAAVSLGRKRAVEKFVEYMGGPAALAEKLRTYLHAAEMTDGRDRVKFLPRYVHG